MAEREVQLLASVPLFNGLSGAELRELLHLGREVEYPSGDAIVEAGMSAMDFYLIMEGTAILEVPGVRRDELGPGASFGEISVLDGQPRSASVTAGSRVLALRIGRPEFIALLDAHGSVARKILVQMCGRLRRAEERIRRPADP
jgi:CRP/FNR family cyclic AMP-dependent transcriptional regulator